MVPTPATLKGAYSSRRLIALLHLVLGYSTRYLLLGESLSRLPQRRGEARQHDHKFIVFACLIPIFVFLSGIFAGLTLGYMSLDVTQLNVLSISGTPQQRVYANKIIPVRKNGHLLLVTLLLSNMIVNESLPIIMDPILGGGVQSIIVSTALIVIFSEIIPQSLFTRHGLYLGAKLATPTRCLLYTIGIIAWPVAKLLELTLGPHHGIIYRRAELKELIAMHSYTGSHGGDLKHDTVTIIGATLDLQEKVVKQAMTPIEDVFMLDLNSKLDYELLSKICSTGHSRVPVYEELELSAGVLGVGSPAKKVKKVVGILLVKQCVLLDPNDAVPLRKIPLNRVLFVTMDEPLLGILDRFQEGRSHMAVVSKFSVEKATSVKIAIKHGLTQRLRQSVGMGDSDSSSDEGKDRGIVFYGDSEVRHGEDETPRVNDSFKKGKGRKRRRGHRAVVSRVKDDVEAGATPNSQAEKQRGEEGYDPDKRPKPKGLANLAIKSRPNSTSLEQNMPADAVLAKQGAKEILQGFDPAIDPLGIITLEDVLEELIGEEIYDEFDSQGARADLSYAVARVEPTVHGDGSSATSIHATATNSDKGHPIANTSVKATSLMGLPLRTRSAPYISDISSKSVTTGNTISPSSAPSPLKPSGWTPSRSSLVDNVGADMITPLPTSLPFKTAEEFVDWPLPQGSSSIQNVDGKSESAMAEKADGTRHLEKEGTDERIPGSKDKEGPD